MTKDEIIDYILNSPENTNSNVLKGMLDQLDNGGGNEDFSIAEVTITNYYFANMTIPIIENEVINNIVISENGTYNVPIYKNGTQIYASISGAVEIAVTGGISYDPMNNSFLIQGNGTILFYSIK